jgi:hypothetical protein
MGIRDRSNGPSLANATYKADRGPAPSRERRQAELTLEASTAAKTRRSLKILHKDGVAAWLADILKQQR